MKYLKVILIGWLLGFLVAYGLSFIPPRGVSLDNVKPAHNMGGSWKLSVSTTPWKGINAYTWTWWAGENTPANTNENFLVQGSTPAKLEGAMGQYGLVLGGFRPWISWTGWAIGLIALYLLWPRSRKVQTNKTGRYVRPRGPRVDLRSEVD